MNKDVLRAISGKPFRNVVTPVLSFQCGKCREIMTETLATAHLKKCQPHGAICGVCREVVSAEKFVEHIKNCKGKKTNG
jgi:uncharacterized CHY-type Zn-finger protein